MGFTSTSNWITQVVTNAKRARYDWNKLTTAVGPYTAGRWYDMSVIGPYPPAMIYGEWLSNPVPTGSYCCWTLGANWTYSSNTFVKASGASNLAQAPLNCVNGRTYRVAFTIASNVGDGFTLALNGGSASAAQTASGTVNLVAGASAATGLVISPKTATNTAVFSNFSVIETLGAYQISNTNPCGSMHVGENVSPDTKHVLGAGVVSAVATFNPGTWMLCDYLMCYPYIDMNTAAVQTLSNVAFSLPRYTSGSGVRAFLVITNGPVGVNANNVTINYTNSAGSTSLGQTMSVTVANTISAIVGHITHSGLAQQNFGPFLPLAPGDNGIQSIQSIQFSAAGGTASTYASLVLARPLLWIPNLTTSVETERDFMNQIANFPRIYDGAYLNWLFLAGGAVVNASQATGYLDVCWG